MACAQILWEKLPWPDVEALLEKTPAAILPLGATEQHGPHMGCGMDFVLADTLCRRVAENTGVSMLPTMHWGIAGAGRAPLPCPPRP